MADEIKSRGLDPAIDAERRLRALIDELLELRKLERGWDDEGAAAPLPELVDVAIHFVRTNRNVLPSRVVPVNDGRVTLEWDLGAYFVSLRIESENRGRLMTVKPDGSTEFSKIDLK